MEMRVAKLPGSDRWKAIPKPWWHAFQQRGAQLVAAENVEPTDRPVDLPPDFVPLTLPEEEEATVGGASAVASSSEGATVAIGLSSDESAALKDELRKAAIAVRLAPHDPNEGLLAPRTSAPIVRETRAPRCKMCGEKMLPKPNHPGVCKSCVPRRSFA